jgi:putative PIN family toxin of toxin-antitoxin system
MLTTDPLAPLRLVLDTNVVIDWLVFEDPRAALLGSAVAEHRAQVLSYDIAVDELRRVLTYPLLKLSPTRQSDVLTRYVDSSTTATLPQGFALDQLLTPAGFPRCRDPDDQHFAAAAFHTRAHALVSQDKAVLKMRRRAARFGVAILNVAELAPLLQR